MKKVLEDLYFGEIQPNISNPDENSRLKKAEQIVDENEEILLKFCIWVQARCKNYFRIRCRAVST